MKTCKHGHKMTKANVNPGGRCRACKRAAAARWLAKHRTEKKRTEG